MLRRGFFRKNDSTFDDAAHLSDTDHLTADVIAFVHRLVARADSSINAYLTDMPLREAHTGVVLRVSAQLAFSPPPPNTELPRHDRWNGTWTPFEYAEPDQEITEKTKSVVDVYVNDRDIRADEEESWRDIQDRAARLNNSEHADKKIVVNLHGPSGPL